MRPRFWATRVISLACLPLLLVTLSSADAQEPPQYQVEVVIFAHNSFVDTPYPAINLPDLTDAIALETTVIESETEATLDRTAADVGIEYPAPGTALLAGTAAAMQRRSNYTLIEHLSWTQPAVAFGSPIPVRIQGKFEDGPKEYDLDGSITLRRGRFLHLDLDLVLEEIIRQPWYLQEPSERGYDYDRIRDSQGFENASPRPSQSSFLLDPGTEQDGPLLPDEDQQEAEAQQPQGYRLTEKRQIRVGRSHYFDHARFGVIAQVVRLQSEEPAE